jgi:hypothetical protein
MEGVPAPTAEDLAGLRILEDEFRTYGRRTRGFLATLGAMARRERDRLRSLVSRELDRRLAREEALLSLAERRAMARCKSLLDESPGPLHAPHEVDRRRGEAFVGESQEAFLDALERCAELAARHGPGETERRPDSRSGLAAEPSRYPRWRREAIDRVSPPGLDRAEGSEGP